jgi:N-methylhydantoinase B
MSQQAAVDAVTIEVVRNYMQSAARQMRNVLVRASCNPVIYEIIDFSQALYNSRADLIAEGPGLPHFMGTLRFAIQNVMRYVGEANVEEGDVLLCTYPYWTGSHSQDATVIRPIFVDGRIFGYAASKAHWMDIGAKDIYGTDTTDIWQEGLQIYGAKVRKAGVPNRDITEIIRANSRLPDSVLGDLNAQIAACDLGARRMVELVAKYGAGTVDAAFDAILDHGERITRQAIREAPDGEWSASGALDNNGLTSEPVPIRVTVRIQGDELTVDTTGSAHQQAGPTNSPFPATVAFSRLAVKRLMLPGYDANEGCFRPLQVVAPAGTIFNANPPAPVFQYGQHAAIMGELIMIALAQAMPERVVARSGGSECAFLFSGTDPQRGEYFAGADIDGVGQGASGDADGESALIVYFGGDARNLPIEVLESRFPIQTLKYELRQDSGGAGRFRGGLGVVKIWKPLVDLRCITVVEQTKCPPTGLFGGRDGAPNIMVMNAHTPHESRQGKQSGNTMRADGEWHLHSAGGGGWGAPEERDPQAVLDDVIKGFVSQESAERDYGVVLRTRGRKLVIDAAATRDRRASRPSPS